MGGLTYRDAGVDIDKKTGVLSRIGNEFAHYFEPISKTLLRHSSNRTTKA